MTDTTSNPDTLIPQFKLERSLNQDQAGRRIVLLGNIFKKPALLILERAPFPSADAYLAKLPTTLKSLQNLGANDIYYWFLAQGGTPEPPCDSSSFNIGDFADLKLNLIYPSTAQHIKKYSQQGVRMVRETPEIYHNKVRPYMQQKREEGRLNWVYNIIDGKTEVDDVIFRTPLQREGNEGFLLLPDLNWDRKTMENMHLLGVVERRDLWSLRDLKKGHVDWLRHMRERFITAITQTYPEIEEDLLKLYVHYQPTYYHLHIHIVHVALESGITQAIGKAIGLESIISQLETMEGGDKMDMDTVTLHYTVGEASEVWTDIFEPIKNACKASPQQ